MECAYLILEKTCLKWLMLSCIFPLMTHVELNYTSGASGVTISMCRYHLSVKPSFFFLNVCDSGVNRPKKREVGGFFSPLWQITLKDNNKWGGGLSPQPSPLRFTQVVCDVCHYHLLVALMFSGTDTSLIRLLFHNNCMNTTAVRLLRQR